MTWSTLIPLILEYGLPAVEKLWQLMTSNTAPTQSDWDALKALTSQTAKCRMLVQLKAAGIDPTSPAGIALLALVS